MAQCIPLQPMRKQRSKHQVLYFKFGDELLHSSNSNEKQFKVFHGDSFNFSQQALNFIESEYFKKVFLSYDKAFVIILKCNEVNLTFSHSTLNTLNDTYGGESRPFIICLESPNEREICFKTGGEGAFSRVNYRESLEFNFESIMCNLQNGLWGSLGDTFLNTLISFQPHPDGLRIIDKALLRNDHLCIRFLNLFDVKLDEINSFERHAIEYAAMNCDVGGIFALYGLGFNLDYSELQYVDISKVLKETYNDG